MLTGAEVDQTAGLLTLRERHPFTVTGTAETLAVPRRQLDLQRAGTGCGDAASDHAGPASSPCVAAWKRELFVVPGKVPLYLEGRNPETDAETGTNVGVELSAAGKRLA